MTAFPTILQAIEIENNPRLNRKQRKHKIKMLSDVTLRPFRNPDQNLLEKIYINVERSLKIRFFLAFLWEHKEPILMILISFFGMFWALNVFGFALFRI